MRDEFCSIEGCSEEAYIRMLPFHLDGSENPFAGRLYCKHHFYRGVFESSSEVNTRWPEGAEL